MPKEREINKTSCSGELFVYKVQFNADIDIVVMPQKVGIEAIANQRITSTIRFCLAKLQRLAKSIQSCYNIFTKLEISMVRLLHWLIRCYQIAISPLLGPRCRYIPTCSQYAIEAFANTWAVNSVWLSTKTRLSLSSLGRIRLWSSTTQSTSFFYFVSSNRFSNASRCCTLSWSFIQNKISKFGIDMQTMGQI